MFVPILRPLWRRLPFDIQTRQRIQRAFFRWLPFLFASHPAMRDYRRLRNPDQIALLMDGLARAARAAPVPLLAETPPPITPPVRLIAFYLPQFHPIPENDAWWGPGFTEWTNVVRGKPRFPGHDQPRLPGELGFYDLRLPEIQARQVELARLHGIGGFAFYFYWFAGQRLLERPVRQYLDSALDLPFCLCWANENWSRRWDGREQDLLIAQHHSPDDDLAFIAHVADYLRDPRYIRVRGRPLLLIYRPSLFPDAAATAARWRDWCRAQGIGEIFLAYTQSFEAVDPARYGFDAALEFPPNNMHPPDITRRIPQLDPEFRGTILDWRAFPERSRHYDTPAYPLFRGVNPGWDNEARRNGSGTTFLGATPGGYREWLENAIADTCARFADPSERLVFINAWNEWAEGAYLEPDQRHGYAYLQATRDALVYSHARTRRDILLIAHDAYEHGAQYLALHLATQLKECFGFRVTMVVLGPGPLLEAYARVAEIHQIDAEVADKAPGRELARALRALGIDNALLNSTASGRFAPSLRAAGIRTIALVHELPVLIRDLKLKKQVQVIARDADRIVFPARIVQDGFASFAPLAPGKVRIRPQGLYKRNRFASPAATGQARAALRVWLGLAADTPIILGVGYGDRRKGLDLFVDIGLAIRQTRPDVRCVWVGRLAPELRPSLDRLLAAADATATFLFPGHQSDTDACYAGADVYAMTSREDPFPSVVLESFEVGVPVVAFAGTGGFSELGTSAALALVPAFDVDAFAAATLGLLTDPARHAAAGAAARALIAREFGFRRYLFDLLAESTAPLPRVSVVVPNYNYGRYLPGRIASILAQTLPCYELIVLDDASTDDSRAWLATELGRLAPEAQVVLNDANSGSVFAQWLRGVQLARGDFVWIAEADDLAEPDFLGEALRGFDDPAVVLSYTQSQQIGPDDELLCPDYLDYVADLSRERWTRPYVRDGREEIAQALAVKNSIPNVSGCVFRREPLRQVLATHLEHIRAYRIAGDWVTYVELLRAGSIAFSPRALNRHRRHGASMTLGHFDRTLLGEIAQVQAWVAATCAIDDTTRARAADYIEELRVQFGLAPE